jgi:hypothetical protein
LHEAEELIAHFQFGLLAIRSDVPPKNRTPDYAIGPKSNQSEIKWQSLANMPEKKHKVITVPVNVIA